MLVQRQLTKRFLIMLERLERRSSRTNALEETREAPANRAAAAWKPSQSGRRHWPLDVPQVGHVEGVWLLPAAAGAASIKRPSFWRRLPVSLPKKNLG